MPRRPCEAAADLAREAKRQAAWNHCTYCLGLVTCLRTVVTAGTMQSLLGASPAVFLRQAEAAKGEVDLIMFDPNSFVVGSAPSLNFSAVRANVESAAAKVEERVGASRP